MNIPGSYSAEEARPFDVRALPPDRLLVLVAGICAVAFGVLAFILYFAGETYPRTAWGFSALGGAVFSFAVALAFGLGMLLAFSQMAHRPAEGAILALAFSVVLLAFGALPGLIAGVVGLVGSLVGIVRNMKFSS